MVRITIDEEMKKKLLVSNEIIELYDDSGKLLARVLPEVEDPLKGLTPITPEFTEEELKRRSEDNGPGITTEELIARLRAKQ